MGRDDLMSERTDRITTLHFAKYLSKSASGIKEIQAWRQLPTIDSPKLQAHAETLTRYLREKNIEVSDSLLVELACFVPGLNRGIKPPLDCLNENRGGFSASRLGEATRFLEYLQARLFFFQALPVQISQDLEKMVPPPELTDERLNRDATRDLIAIQQLSQHLPDSRNISHQLIEEYRQLASMQIPELTQHARQFLANPPCPISQRLPKRFLHILLA
jgi:hypothetical protein